MRITCIISSLSSGGAERVMSIIANYWSVYGKEITIITYRDERRYPVFYELDKNIHYISIYHRRKLISIIQFFFKLRKEIKKSKPDLVLSFMDESNVLSLLSTIGLKIPVVVSERTNPQKYFPAFYIRLLRRILYPYAKFIVIQTENIKQSFPKYFRNKMVVIPNPVIINSDKITNPDYELKKPFILAIGRLSYEKGFDLLIEVFGKINELFPVWHLYIFGKGPQKESLMKLINDLKLSDKVHLPGETKSSQEIMKQADIFILPSRYEGFPNVLCEAMSVGSSVISFNCPYGPAEIIDDKNRGVLVKNEDKGELFKAIKYLIKNPTIRKQIGENARQIVQKFGINNVMPLWDEVVNKAIKK